MIEGYDSLTPTQQQSVRTLFQELSRREAWEYCLYHDYDFFSKRLYLQPVADTFQYLIEQEETPEAIIDRIESNRFVKKFTRNPEKATANMPPRAGKSYITSVCCAWAIGKYPVESIMRNSCTARLYEKFSYDVREIVRSDKFKEVFPSIKLSNDKQNIAGWNTTKAKQVSYFGAGVGGSIIGFGASLIAITDDLYKSIDDALSSTVNDKVVRWKEGTHDSRLEGACPEYDIGTRWTKSDIIGQTMANNDYDIIITIPALVDNKSFCEEVRSTKKYLQIREKIAKELWLAEYMQEPVEFEGIALPEKDLQRFKMKDFKPSLAEMRVATIDTADDGDDFLSMPIGYLIGGKIYIPDLIFTASDVDVTEPLCAAKCIEHTLKYCRIETNAGGSGFMKHLRKVAGATIVTGSFTTSNKHTRILSNIGMIKKYCVFRDDYEDGSDYDKFMKNMTGYLKNGKSKHDDAIDSVTALIEYLLKIAYSYFK